MFFEKLGKMTSLSIEIISLIYEYKTGINLLQEHPNGLQILKTNDLFLIQFITNRYDIDLLEELYQHYSSKNKDYLLGRLQDYVHLSLGVLEYLIKTKEPSINQLVYMLAHIQMDNHVDEHRFICTLLSEKIDESSLSKLCADSVKRGMDNSQYKFVYYILSSYDVVYNRGYIFSTKVGQLTPSLLDLIISNCIPISRSCLSHSLFRLLCTICMKPMLECKCEFITYDEKKYYLTKMPLLTDLHFRDIL